MDAVRFASPLQRAADHVSGIDHDIVSSEEPLEFLLKRHLRVMCLLLFDGSRGNRSVAR
jgi:hypothetical protein